MESIEKIFQVGIIIVGCVIGALYIAQNILIQYRTRNMSDEEFRKYIKENNLY